MPTLPSVLESEAALVRDAALALPHQCSQCTHNLGYIRQAVYLCLTCTAPRGICSACSVACHTDHEQLELFPKRAFRCDCPTTALPHTCTLTGASPAPPNAQNTYGQNFHGKFCRCGRAYDPHTERETMIQCLACEDWYHESCLNLRNRPPLVPEPGAADGAPRGDAVAPGEIDDDDMQSVASDPSLPRALLTSDDYDALVCSACVLAIPIMRRMAGTPGVLTIVRSSEATPWQVMGAPHDAESIDPLESSELPSAAASAKRASSPASAAEQRAVKRSRTDDGACTTSNGPELCLAPLPIPEVQNMLEKTASDSADALNGAGDVFLTDGWRTRWCHCVTCLPSLQSHPFLETEEETYEPPDDPDSSLTLEELGLRALASVPHADAIEGIHHFNDMKDDLKAYLRPFAEQGREVREDDIRDFFARRREEMLARARATA